jgi:hypothetical protein
VPGLWGFRIGCGVYGAKPWGLLLVALSFDWWKTGSWRGSLRGRFLEVRTGLAGILERTVRTGARSANVGLTLWG